MTIVELAAWIFVVIFGTRLVFGLLSLALTTVVTVGVLLLAVLQTAIERLKKEPSGS